MKNFGFSFLSVVGWALLGWAIFSAFTIVPLCLGLSFMETSGPINSGDQGAQLFVMLFLCLLPSVFGPSLLLLRRKLEKIPLKKFGQRCLALIAFQSAAFGLALLLIPKSEALGQEEFQNANRPTAEAIQKLKEIINGK